MSYQALYRKYRPHCFDDFVDQDNVKKILINSIINNKISHAYLFSGPRGIGKTSMAKIFAKAINCTDFAKNNDVCEKCDNCKEANENSVDIIEIDAASNNGVEQIRDLKNKISIVPSKLKYKVYIVDEVHMLTNSAFNALLKTLEEPPSHVVFILATTEFYEVPETIVSRCQCFSFSRITLNSLVERLKYIANKEKIDIDENALVEIAHFSNGGLRDAIGMLDKIHSFTNEKITVDVYKSINGMISQEDIIAFYNKICEKDINGILSMIDNVNDQGYDFKNFVERVMIYTRDKIILHYKKEEILDNVDKNIELISTLNEILNRLKDAVNEVVIVQIYLLKYIENISREIILPSEKMLGNNQKKDQDFKIQKNESNGQNDVKNSQNPLNTIQKPAKNVKIVVNEEIKKIRINNAMATANLQFKKELGEMWKKLDKYFMDSKNGKIAQLLSDTQPMVVGTDYLLLTTESNGIIDNIYSNLNLVENFLTELYRHLAVVVVKNDEFD